MDLRARAAPPLVESPFAPAEPRERGCPVGAQPETFAPEGGTKRMKPETRETDVTKRLEAGGSYSPTELLTIGLELQTQVDQLRIIVDNQGQALVRQRLLLEESDAASGMKHSTPECEEFYRLAVEMFGERLQVQVLAEEAAELSLAALKLLRSGCSRDLLPKLAEEIADTTIMIQQAFVLYPGLATAATTQRVRKIERTKERIAQATP